MNKFTLGFSIINFIGLLLLLILHFYPNNRVVYVDSTKIINSYHGMIEARKGYQEKITKWKANIDTLAKEVQIEIARYEKESLHMTVKEKELTKQLIRGKQQQLGEYQKAINEQASQEDAEATKKVVGEINTYIKNYGQRHNFSIIFAATEYGNIAFAKEGLDITEEILGGLNGSYPEKK